MTFDEYNEKFLELERDAAEIQLAKKNLREEFIKTAPFQPGQKVRVTGNDCFGKKTITVVCFIKSVAPASKIGTNNGYSYSFWQMKQDGSQSMREQHFYAERYTVEMVVE